jgi:hypothetical protein
MASPTFCIGASPGRPAPLLANGARYSRPNVRIAKSSPLRDYALMGQTRLQGPEPRPSGVSMSISIAEINIPSRFHESAAITEQQFDRDLSNASNLKPGDDIGSETNQTVPDRRSGHGHRTMKRCGNYSIDSEYFLW